MDAKGYLEGHFTEFVDQLKQLVKIPSVSFANFPVAEVNRSAEAVRDLLKTEGLENVEILRIGEAHPYVYGDWLHAPGKPTVLLYAHHDVQPPGRTELWKTPPFEPVEIAGRLFGRGSADDKAGIIVHTATVRSLLKTVGKLPVNVKLIIEGEEEIGSDHLEAFLKVYRQKLQADVMVLTDTSNFDTGIPSITTSLRGLVAVEVEVRVMDHPLHSGAWGGPIPDPVIALSKILSGLLDDDGRIAIPGIYDDVLPLTAIERKSVESLQYSDDDFRKQAQLIPSVKIVGGKELPQIKMTRLPSLTVNAIEASSRKDVSNIVPEAAWGKLGIRIVPNMDPNRVLKMLKDFLTSKAPWGVEVKISATQNSTWWLTGAEGPVFEMARTSLTNAFGRDCVYVGQGGSIPFVEPFSKVLGGVPAILIGVEDPYTNAHSENESVHLEDLKKTILGMIYFYEKLGSWKR